MSYNTGTKSSKHNTALVGKGLQPHRSYGEMCMYVCVYIFIYKLGKVIEFGEKLA